MESNNLDLERINNLIIETAKMMSKYRQDSEEIVINIQKELDKSLVQQRKMIINMVQEELTQQTAHELREYVDDMANARSQMVEQVREFNIHLNRVTSKNQRIFRQTVLSGAITLAILLIGGIALIYFYSSIIVSKKRESDIISQINRADIVRCGENLCAKTGKTVLNGYRIILNK